MAIIRTSTIIAAAMALLGCTGCQGNGGSSGATGGADPFDLGKADGKALTEQCTTESEVRLRLLEIRSRITRLQETAGERAAERYEDGFRASLAQSDDTLAQTLFD